MPKQHQMVIDLQDPPTVKDGNWEMLEQVLWGDKASDISFEGCWMLSLSSVNMSVRCKFLYFFSTNLFLFSFLSQNHHTDNHTCHDRTERQQQLFEPQMEDITNAYMAWSHDEAQCATTNANPGDNNMYSLTVMDILIM
jgi:hypothetical protein